MRIVFMGTPAFAVPSLNALLRSDDEVVGVVTQPDRPKGRGQELAASPIKQLAERHHLPILQPLKMREPDFLEALRAWQPDLIAVAAFGRILPPVILSLPPQGCINVHASLLPKYRGAGPIQWAILNGEHETGITTMLMDEGMDTGAILLQERVTIMPDDTAGTLSAKLADVGGRLLLDTLRRLKEHRLTPRPQDSAQATMAPLLKKEDGLIDWKRPAEELANRVRGLTPWPGAYTYAYATRWTIWRAAVVPGDPAGTPGAILRVPKDGIVVATGKGSLMITELQAANSRKMTATDYLAGHPVAAGSVLGAGPAPHEDEAHGATNK